MWKVAMKIDGMMCGMCEAHVNDVIRKNVRNAKKVSSSCRKGTCTFICDDTPEREKIRQALSAIGYEVREIECTEYEKKAGLFG